MGKSGGGTRRGGSRSGRGRGKGGSGRYGHVRLETALFKRGSTARKLVYMLALRVHISFLLLCCVCHRHSSTSPKAQ